MPYVKIEVAGGTTREQKAGLVADVTQSLVDRLGKKPDQVFVVIHEVSTENWGVGGDLLADRMGSAPAREDAHAAVTSQ